MTPGETKVARAGRSPEKRAARVERAIAAWERAGEPEPAKDTPDGRYCPTTTQIEAEAARIKAETFANLGKRRIKNLGVKLMPRTPKIYPDPRRFT